MFQIKVRAYCVTEPSLSLTAMDTQPLPGSEQPIAGLYSGKSAQHKKEKCPFSVVSTTLSATHACVIGTAFMTTKTTCLFISSLTISLLFVIWRSLNFVSLSYLVLWYLRKNQFAGFVSTVPRTNYQPTSRLLKIIPSH